MSKKILFLLVIFISHLVYASETTLTVTVDKMYNLPLVTLDLNKEKVTFTLDTGAKTA